MAQAQNDTPQGGAADDVDDFAAAFAEAAGEAEREITGAKSDPATAADAKQDDAAKTEDKTDDKTDDKTADDTSKTDPAAQKGPAESGADPAADAAKVAADAAAAAEAARVAEQNALATAAAERALQARQTADETAAAKAAEAEAKKVADAAAAAVLAPYEFSAEEKAAMEKMKAEFPNEYMALEARIKSVDKTVAAQVAKVREELLKELKSSVEPVAAAQAQSVEQSHWTAIRTAHPDFQTVSAALPDWIAKQPRLLQPAYKHAYEQGDTATVIELMTAYKESTGTKPPATDDAAAAAKAEADAKKAADAKAAASALAPVSAKRVQTSPAGTRDPNDYAGAWAEAAEENR